MRRIDQVSRLLSKKPVVKKGSYERQRCLNEAKDMVKRKTEIMVGSASVSAATDDMRKKAKENQEWMYPNGVIQRYPTVEINGKRYTDDKNPGEARRKHESNFFITLNTNRTMKRIPALHAEWAKNAFEKALHDLAKDDALAKYIKFGPKSDHYRNDCYEDIIQSVEWNSAIETGDQQCRLHCHIWLTVHHYSQIQINMPMMQKAFKERYMHHLGSSPPKEIVINKNPYIQVKLLPTANWAQVIKQYMAKAMGPATFQSDC